MTCGELDILLCDYLDGTLSAGEAARVESHLASCASCAEMAKDARLAMSFMERAAEVEPPPQLMTPHTPLFPVPTRSRLARASRRYWTGSRATGFAPSLLRMHPASPASC